MAWLGRPDRLPPPQRASCWVVACAVCVLSVEYNGGRASVDIDGDPWAHGPSLQLSYGAGGVPRAWNRVGDDFSAQGAMGDGRDGPFAQVVVVGEGEGEESESEAEVTASQPQVKAS